ncbi:MAG: YidC/Oxa1 family insertase periplasmic-domain containing protein, partial [Ignavibacteria bacterium]|nr:YidC/Oxa1 family insertase periplasmic-domain containing protein [Ignavibacteria bacterium]
EKMDDVISSYRYDVEWSNGLNFLEENSVDEATHANASAFSGDEQVMIDASTVGEKVEKDINGTVDWVATRNKYFAMILAPNAPSNEGGAYFEGTHIANNFGTREIYSASLKIPFKNQKYQKDSFTLYVGPIDYYLLKTYNNNYESIFEFGNFLGLKFIIRPISEYIMLPLLRFLDSFIPNYGLVIILFTIIIKLALSPLTKTSLKSMAKMQQLQPMIAELKEKYKDNQQKQQQETMKLYQTYGINPMGGCLPMLLQMPILVALWSLFNVAIDIRQQPFMLWIDNLSSPDIIYKLPFTLPLGINVISGLAILMGITMFIQQKMSVKDPTQKAMIYIMPVMFTVMFMSMPSGLNLYYFVFNLLGIIQQYYVTHKHNLEPLVAVANPNKKKGFMARMMDAAEKQAHVQKQAKKK